MGFDNSKEAGILYKSVIKDGKFIVLVADGIFHTPLMELPTEELADKVAYELQSAVLPVYSSHVESVALLVQKDN